MFKLFRNFYFAIFLLIVLTSTAQYDWDYGGAVGASNYLGDIGGKENPRRDFVADMKMAKTRFDISAFARYRYRKQVYFKGELSFIRIAGDDALTTYAPRRYRNFNFTNNLLELSATSQWMFAENTDMGGSYRFRNAIRFYAFSGLALVIHNPKTKLNGSRVPLRPLKTEGQSKPYSRFTLAIPVGLGLHYTYKKRHRFGLEFNWRTVFSDYLDDIKGNYPDPTKVSAATAEAVYRTNINEANTYEPGFANNYDGNYYDSNGDGIADKPDQRGDASHNDSYLTLNVSYSYVMRGRSNFNRSKYGNFFRKKSKRKSYRTKVRAKL
jgi:Domain of unknown function (DUF6089)